MQHLMVLEHHFINIHKNSFGLFRDFINLPIKLLFLLIFKTEELKLKKIWIKCMSSKPCHNNINVLLFMILKIMCFYSLIANGYLVRIYNRLLIFQSKPYNIVFRNRAILSE